MASEELSPAELFLLVVMCVGIVLSVFGNFCVIAIVVRNKRMRNATNVMISGLAVSDIFLGAFVLPQNVHDTTHSSNFYEGVLACKLVNALPILCIYCSIYIMVAMSFERYNAIACMPPKPMSTKATKTIIAAILLSAVIVSIPTMMEYDVYKVQLERVPDQTPSYFEEPFGGSAWDSNNNNNNNHNNSSQHVTPTAGSTSGIRMDFEAEMTSTTNDYEQGGGGVQYILECGNDRVSPILGQINAVFLLIVAYIGPTCCIWVNYSRLIRFIIAHSKHRNAVSAGQMTNSGTAPKMTSSLQLPKQSAAAAVVPPVPKTPASFRRKVKVVKMLVFVAALFQVCWLPYFAVLLYSKSSGKDDSSNHSGAFYVLRIMLSIFSVSYNAYLYAVYNPMFREGFKRILCLGRSRMRVGDSFPVTTHTASVFRVQRVQLSRDDRDHELVMTRSSGSGSDHLTKKNRLSV